MSPTGFVATGVVVFVVVAGVDLATVVFLVGVDVVFLTATVFATVGFV